MVKISIETVRRANATGIARRHLKKIGLSFDKSDIHPEIKRIMADKERLKAAFKKAWDSVVNNKL